MKLIKCEKGYDLSFQTRGSYPRYNEFEDKMPLEVVIEMEIARRKDVARWEGDDSP